MTLHYVRKSGAPQKNPKKVCLVVVLLMIVFKFLKMPRQKIDLIVFQDSHTVSILGGKLERFVLVTNVDWRMYVAEIQTNETKHVHR